MLFRSMKACRGVAQDREEIPRLAFAFPVIVVDSPLFKCSLPEKGGDLRLQEVEQSEFLFSTHIPENIGCCVKVITRSHLDSFAPWAKEVADAIRAELKVEEDMAFKAGSHADRGS